MLDPIQPMEPKASTSIPRGEEWLAQVKWDGVRVLTHYNGEKVHLFNRRGRERTDHYPELLAIKEYCRASSVILDGEVIALGDKGKPSFSEVMRRDGIKKMAMVEGLRKAVPITYMVFDVLYYNGRWVNKNPLGKRITILEEILIPGPNIQPVFSHGDGQELFRAVQKEGMEGVVVKQKGSVYCFGGKSDSWLKIKNYFDLIAVVAGYTLSGSQVKSVLLGLFDELGNLWYIGHCGTGKLRKREWQDLSSVFRSLQVEEQPFVNRPQRYKDVLWLKPKITVKVNYAGWTEGGSLRQPSIQALVDVSPELCQYNQLLGQG
ncbi:MAG: non-homologous end-joining DNA ligase [Desulfitobacteriia bacterium]